MADNDIWIEIKAKKGTLTEEMLREIFLYPKKWGEKISEIIAKEYGNEDDYLERAIANSFDKKLTSSDDSALSKLDTTGIHYKWFRIYCWDRDEFDVIKISFHKGNVNPNNIDEKRNLDNFYQITERFIEFTKFIWNLFGKNGIYAVADWELILYSL